MMVFSLASLSHAINEEPLELITAQEAATPDMPSFIWHLEAGRDEGGPVIEVITPQSGKPYKSPLQIIVRFIPKDGNEVDLSTLKVEYLKLFTIDLTPKVKPYATEDGIKISEAKLPSGIHTIRVTIGDVRGAVTRQVFSVEVL